MVVSPRRSGERVYLFNIYIYNITDEARSLAAPVGGKPWTWFTLNGDTVPVQGAIIETVDVLGVS